MQESPNKIYINMYPDIFNKRGWDSLSDYKAIDCTTREESCSIQIASPHAQPQGKSIDH